MNRPINISPRPDVYRDRKARVPRNQKWHVNIVREKITDWPENLKQEFNTLEEQVDEDNESLKIYKVLKKLKADLPEDTCEIEECINIIRKSNLDINNLNDSPDYIPENVGLEESLNCTKKVHYTPEEGVCCSPPNDIKKSKSENSNKWLWLSGLLFFIFAICIAIQLPSNEPQVELGKIEEWTQNIKLLQEKFPSQSDDVWYSIVAGVKTIVTEKPTKPSVLLLLHNDERTSTCLANKIGKEAVKLLSGTIQEPIIIHGKTLKLNKSLTEDYGLFSETYKHDIEKKHVMIVLDLQEIPAMLAQTFHVLCDVENPLVHNAAFLFTMQVDESNTQHPTAIAEKYLLQLWKDTLHIDIRDPLITRITDAVVSVNMESHLPC